MEIISLLVPVYNEKEILGIFYDKILEISNKLNNYEWEFLFINDGSKDNTLDKLKELRKKDHRVCYVNLSRNFGKEKAMLAGFDYVNGDCTIIMDADLQDPPELIEQMIALWKQGYDDVYARRNYRGKESWFRKKLSLAFYWLLQRMTKIDILPNVGDFRLLDKRCILVLRKIRESERYTKGLFCWIGYNKKEILFDRGNRIGGESSWSLPSLFNLAVEGITTFTIVPLRIATILGFAVSIFSIMYMLFFLVKTAFIGDTTPGFPTLIIIILFLGSVQLLSLGIIGEYLGRVFLESKNRPTYIASEYNETKL